MHIWSTILFSVAFVGLIYTTIAWALLAVSCRQRKSKGDSDFTPSVSIFKPLKGVDDSLLENIESFFAQNYSHYELIFGVNDSDDPAIAVVRQLQAAYPKVQTQLVINSHKAGYNPKINNLCNMVPFANHEYWIVSDSNIRVGRNYIQELVSHMHDPEVGLVTSLIRGVGGMQFGAKLENLHLNSFVAASTVAVNRLSRIPVSIGKSMLIRRETVSLLGGFESFANYLMEDGLIGRQVRNLGLKTATSMSAVENVNDGWSVGDFLSRHYRWGLMRRHLNLLHYSGEIVSNPIFLSLLAVAISPSVATASLGATIAALKVVLDLKAVHTTGGRLQWSSAMLLPVKDLLIAYVWWKPFFTNRVSWRGNRFQIGAMTAITPLLPADEQPAVIANTLIGFYYDTRRRLATWELEA